MTNTWRSRLIAALVGRVRSGTLTLAQFDQRVEEAVAADDDRALTLVAKQLAAVDGETQRAQAERAGEREREQRAVQRQRAVGSLVRLLERMLGIDAAARAGSAEDVFFDVPGIAIDGIWYWVANDLQTRYAHRGPVIRIGRRCPYYDRGPFCGNVIIATPHVTGLVSLGRALTSLDDQPTCLYWECGLRAAGASEEAIAAERERRQKAMQDASGHIISSAYILSPLPIWRNPASSASARCHPTSTPVPFAPQPSQSAMLEEPPP